MPPPFKQIDCEQFFALLKRFDFKRKVESVHMHHTWRPDHSHYDPSNGHRAILGMYIHHTQVNGWQDIAQHITIAPDGTIWLGRNWNLPPASASGHNGNIYAGPFMFEIIGDFEIGRNRFEGIQKEAVVDVIAQVQHRFGLDAETLRFHSQMSNKSCPGSSINRDLLLDQVRTRRAQIGAAISPSRALNDSPFPPEAEANAAVVQEVLAWFGREVPPYVDPPDAEPSYEDKSRSLFPDEPTIKGERKKALTPSVLAELRPHLVNLNGGKFSSDGEWTTDQAEVDAIFDRQLPLSLEEAKQAQRSLRIVFFAHGGLVKESSGLEIAYKHLEWWKNNHVYPIYFVWETGLFETLGQLLSRAQAGVRSFVSDHVTDPLIENAAHIAGGPVIWGGMKSAAELASATPESPYGEGGAHYVASKLKVFCDLHSGEPIELHAVGHSAGSIFHAHFLSAARRIGVPSFKSLHLLAPAIRVDLFSKCLKNLMGSGNGIDQLSVFTMRRDLERDDNCAKIYRKSLLYLIYHALEPERKEPILGLEECLRRDPKMRNLFALDSPHSGNAEVVFSCTPTSEGRSASCSTTHGGFDDDAPTMNSVLRRILGKADADSIVSYPRKRSMAALMDPWENQVDWPARIDEGSPLVSNGKFLFPAASAKTGMAAAAFYTRGVSITGGRKRALCIGINNYPTAPLNGCIADAEDWARTLSELGFEVGVMRDEEATRSAILQTWEGMISQSSPGDVLVLQFAGHGTQLDDLDGDEDDDAKDEAMVPFDYESGAYLIDDDVSDLFSRIPDHVNVTCFFDCCHSGTNTRFAIGPTGQAGGHTRDERRRFMAPTPQMQKAHAAFRVRLPVGRGKRRTSPEEMKNVAFSACLPHESAWESNGHGDFTVRATRILRDGIANVSNDEFGRRIEAAFGAGARQRPLLDCSSSARQRGLLAPLLSQSEAGIEIFPSAPKAKTLSELKQAFQALIDQL